MRFMDPREKLVLQSLVRMAGDPLLVEHALRVLSVTTDAPSIPDVMRFIVENRDEWHAKRAERQPKEQGSGPRRSSSEKYAPVG